jgi:cob(I)alamin adenosyltransferase
MAKRTRIYTRGGDTGQTGLVGGERVSKNSPRIETYGTVDELSSSIGVARSHLRDAARNDAEMRRIDAWLAWTQNMLFNLGAELATPAQHRWAGMPLIGAADIAALERGIDETEADLEPLHAFILPGGDFAGAHLHYARTVCRRAERLLISLREQEPEISGETLRYLNRLSDALFVWARAVSLDSEAAEAQWDAASQPPEDRG